MKSVTAKKLENQRIENQTLGVATAIYCAAMLATLGIGAYGVFSLFQLMFSSLEQVSRMTPWTLI